MFLFNEDWFSYGGMECGLYGTAKGHKLKSLDGMATRPTADKIKESLFNILLPIISDTYVLDLFAGTGSIGIEALSRGAEFAVFIDKNPSAVKIIRENLIHTKLQDKSKIYNADYKKYINNIYDGERAFDIIFIDPPYNKGLIIPAMQLIGEKKLLSPDGLIVVEHGKEENIPEQIGDFKAIRKQDYGRTIITFYK